MRGINETVESVQCAAQDVRHSDSLNDQGHLTSYQTLALAAVFLNMLAHRADGSFLFADC